jgi:hypothetical protein
MSNLHKETLLLWGVGLVGNILPTLLSLLFYLVGQKEMPGWHIFYQQGEFYLYSASFLSVTCYTFYTYKIKNTDWNSILFMVSSALICFVSLLYAWQLAGIVVSIKVIRNTSLLTFVITLGLSYYSSFLSFRKTDVNGAEKEGVKEILDSLP